MDHCLSGTVGSCAGMVLGFPMELVKVQQQAASVAPSPTGAGNPNHTSIRQVLQQTTRTGGIRALFRGLPAPLVTALPVYVVQFGGYGIALNYLTAAPSLWRLTHASTQSVSLTHHLAAGAVAGAASSLITTPTELVKVRMMTQRMQQKDANNTAEKGVRPYRNSLDCAASVLKSHGISALYRGLRLNAVKDSIGFASYFWLYHFLSARTSRLVSDRALVQQPKLANTIGTIVGGGLAGVISWTMVHPLDVIKSVIQAQSLDIKPAPLAVGRQGWREGGARFLFRGWCANTVRAFPCCAVSFFVYDRLLEVMRQRQRALAADDEGCNCETTHVHS